MRNGSEDNFSGKKVFLADVRFLNVEARIKTLCG
jgi:hypothetical protein